MSAQLIKPPICSKRATDEKMKQRRRTPCAQDYYPSTFSQSNSDFSPIRIRKKLLLLSKTKRKECMRRSEKIQPECSPAASVHSSSFESISDSSSISSKSGAIRHDNQPGAPKSTTASASSTFDGVGDLYRTTRPAALISESMHSNRSAKFRTDTLTTIESSSSYLESNLTASTSIQSSASSSSMEDSYSIMQKIRFDFLKHQLQNKEKEKIPNARVKASVGRYSMHSYTTYKEGTSPSLNEKTRHARSIPRASTVDSAASEKEEVYVSTKRTLSQPNFSRKPTMAALRASIKKIDEEYRVSVSQENKSKSKAPYNDLMLGYSETRKK